MNLEQLHSGHVLLRQGKQKLRIFSPQHFFTCEICGGKLGAKAAKWEGVGGATHLVLCLPCTEIEIKNKQQDQK